MITCLVYLYVFQFFYGFQAFLKLVDNFFLKKKQPYTKYSNKMEKLEMPSRFRIKIFKKMLVSRSPILFSLLSDAFFLNLFG